MKTPWFTGIVVSFSVAAPSAEDGASLVDFLNYKDCIELSNEDTTVVLGPHVGGRVLKYSFQGKDALTSIRVRPSGVHPMRKRSRSRARGALT